MQCKYVKITLKKNQRMDSIKVLIEKRNWTILFEK